MKIELLAYATDCVVTGLLELERERLGDLLAEAGPLVVRDATLQALEDGRVVTLSDLTLQRGELALVAGSGPRGNGARRLATVRRPMIATVGPYEVVGRLHGPPSTAPFDLVRRRSWIAVTDGLVRYRARNRPTAALHDVLLLNTAHLAAIDELDDTALELRLAAAARMGLADAALARRLIPGVPTGPSRIAARMAATAAGATPGPLPAPNPASLPNPGSLPGPRGLPAPVRPSAPRVPPASPGPR